MTTIYRTRTVASPFHPWSTLYVPDGATPAPGVVLLHGSEGACAGWSDCTAALFTQFGFVCAPFGYSIGSDPWQSGRIVDVELSETAKTFDILRAHPAVAGRKVALLGFSRGAEHALLLASLMAQSGLPGMPDAIVAHAPSDTIVSGFRGHDDEDRDEHDPSAHAWNWRGSSSELAPGTRIEIERYPGPVFLSHGISDRLWSADKTRRLEQRLRAVGRNPVVYLYEGDHGIAPADQDAWLDRVVTFLRRTIGS